MKLWFELLETIESAAFLQTWQKQEGDIYYTYSLA